MTGRPKRMPEGLRGRHVRLPPVLELRGGDRVSFRVELAIDPKYAGRPAAWKPLR